MKRTYLGVSVGLAAALCLGACSGSPDSPPTESPTTYGTTTAQPIPPPTSTSPVVTSPPPRPTVTRTVTVTTKPTVVVPDPTATFETGHRVRVTYFFIGENDTDTSHAPAGCTGNRLIPYYQIVDQDGSLLETTVTALLSQPEVRIGSSGLYNPLASSDLLFDSVHMTGNRVILNLKGTLRSGGTCDDSGIVAQLEKTVKTVSGATSVVIRVNGVLIQKLLSASGR